MLNKNVDHVEKSMEKKQQNWYVPFSFGITYLCLFVIQNWDDCNPSNIGTRRERERVEQESDKMKKRKRKLPLLPARTVHNCKIEYNFELISFEKFSGATNVTSKETNAIVAVCVCVFGFAIVLRTNRIGMCSCIATREKYTKNKKKENGFSKSNRNFIRDHGSYITLWQRTVSQKWLQSEESNSNTST